MAQRITPTKVVTVTKDGECHLVITLELNINLNSVNSGGEAVSASIQSHDRASVEEDNVDFTIPDFSSGGTFNFGKED
jgi:hypothetical protein